MVLSHVLYDAVSLRHFAVAGRLDILETRHGHLAPPRWTEAVQTEIAAAAARDAGSRTVLAHAWLGDPIVPTALDQAAIMGIWIGLNDGRRPPIDHAGEAESIHFAGTLSGAFVTDDNAAYDFAERRLGPGQALDTVAVLQEAVSMGELSVAEAVGVTESIRAAGRFLRSVHPERFAAADFS